MRPHNSEDLSPCNMRNFRPELVEIEDTIDTFLIMKCPFHIMKCSFHMKNLSFLHSTCKLNLPTIIESSHINAFAFIWLLSIMLGKFSLHVEWTKQWFLWQLTGFYMKEALSKTLLKKYICRTYWTAGMIAHCGTGSIVTKVLGLNLTSRSL